MENKKCVILSQKDYDDLLSFKKKNNIRIYSDDMFDEEIKRIRILINFENFEILGSVRQRLSSIEKHLQERITEYWQNRSNTYFKMKNNINDSIVDSERKGYNRACKKIANMEFFERRKFLKEFKDGK